MVVAVVVAVAVLAVACGGGQPATVSTGAGTPSAMAADAATASRMLLRAGDLPAGYDIGGVPDPGATDAKAVAEFETCAGPAAALGTAGQSAVSPGYFRGRTVVISSLAVVAPDTAAARGAMADLTEAGAAACLTGLFRSVLGLDQLPGTQATTDRLTAKDSEVTWRTTIQVTADGQKVSAYADLSFFRTGRTVGAVFAFQIGEPFPTDERADLVRAISDRSA